MTTFWDGLVAALTNSQPSLLFPVFAGLVLTSAVIWFANGRFWAFVYFATIPFLNWSFGVVDSIVIAAPGETFSRGIELS